MYFDTSLAGRWLLGLVSQDQSQQYQRQLGGQEIVFTALCQNIIKVYLTARSLTPYFTTERFDVIKLITLIYIPYGLIGLLIARIFQLTRTPFHSRV